MRPALPDLSDLRFLRPELQHQFRRLLYSWDLRQARGKVPGIPTPDPCPPDWEAQFEYKYGDGHFADRATLLKTTLRRLVNRRGVNVDGIAAALAETRTEALLAGLRLRGAAARRWMNREFRLIDKNIPRLLHRAVKFFETVDYNHPVVGNIRAVRDAWPDVPFVRLQRQGIPLERNRRGHQPEPWLSRAENALRAAGVTSREDRHALLVAVGLKPLLP